MIWFSSILPPSGSAASMHRATRMICLTSPACIQTRPFVPTATSNGNRAPRRGSRKCRGLSNLWAKDCLWHVRQWGGFRIRTICTCLSCIWSWIRPWVRQNPRTFDSVHQSTQARVPCLCGPRIPERIPTTQPTQHPFCHTYLQSNIM